MAQLHKIIMINGHLQGVVELDVTGHTNICGSNASGKTTLQRLIPVFYGEQPNRVVPKTRDNFDIYYLPTAASYIIYAYESASGEPSQVVLTKRPDGVDYRFVAAEYNPQHYLQGTGNKRSALSYQAWLSQLKNHNIQVSHKISATSEYRAVLQNDLQASRGPAREQTKFRSLVKRFALVQGAERLRHIEKLVSAVHAKEGKMDTLKSMLAAILEEDGHRSPSHAFKAHKLKSWIQSMRQGLRVDELTEQFQRLSGYAAAQTEQLAELWALKPVLESDFRVAQTTYADTDEALTHLQSEREQGEAALQSQQDAVNQALSAATSELQTVSNQLDDLQQRFDDYEAQDYPALARALKGLPQLQLEAADLQSHIQALTAEQGDAQAQLQQQQLKLHEQLNRFVQQREQQLAAKQVERDTLRASQLQQREQLRHKLAEQQEQVRQQFSQRLQQLQQQHISLQQQLQQGFLTRDDWDEVEAAESRLTAQQEALQQLQQQRLQQRETVAQLQREQSQAEQELALQRAALKQAKQALQASEQACEPAPDSLQAFLAQAIPDWEQQHGKVFANELLQRTDLQPVLHEAAAGYWGGVELDLSQLEPARHAQQLQAQLSQAQASVSAAEAKLKQAEQRLAQASKAVEQAQLALQQVKQQQERGEREVAHARDAKARLKAQQQQLREAQQSEGQQRAQEVESQLNTLQARLEQQLQALKAQITEQQLELEAEGQAELAALDAELAALREAVQAKRASIKAQLTDLEQEFNTDLAHQGVDSTRLQQLKQERAALQEKIQQLLGSQSQIERYQDFMRVAWERDRPQLLEREQRAKQTKSLKQLELEQLQQQLRELKQQAAATQQRLQQTKQQAQEQSKAVQQLLARMATLPVATQAGTATSSGDLEERLQRAETALQSYHVSSRQLQELLEQFESQLRRDAQLEFVQFMEQSLAQAAGQSEQPLNDQQRLAVFADILQVLSDQRQQVIEQGHTIGTQLEQFFTVFNDIHQKVDQYSQRLTAAVRDDLQLASIEQAEVRISSTIDELDFWPALVTLTQLYREWRDNPTALPSPAYLQTLDEVAGLLRAQQEYNLETLLKLELKITERGRDLTIRNDRQLAESSSHGMAYLILCKYLLAFTRMLRSEHAKLILHWPIDEIGTLAYHNVEALFNACRANQIFVVGAFPNPESDVLQLFDRRYLIELDANQQPQLKRIEPRRSELAERLQAVAEEALS